MRHELDALSAAACALECSAVTAPPDIWYLKDTNGDFKADIKEKVFTGFGTGGSQYISNNLQCGLDHKIYAPVAGNGVRSDERIVRTRLQFPFRGRISGSTL